MERSFRDQSLIARVQTYMRENENKVYIDVNEMADTLQRRYRDYRAKKRGAFRAMVRKAYDELTEIFSRKPPIRDCPAYDDDYDDEVDVESDTHQVAIDNLLLGMYKKPQYKQNGGNIVETSDKELIDISSDDDASKAESKTEKNAKETESVSNNVSEEAPSQTPSTVALKSEPVALKQETQPVLSQPANEVAKQPSAEPSRKRHREKENEIGHIVITKRMKYIPVTESKVTFCNIGGSEKVLKIVCKLLGHMKHPEIFKQLGISPPRGFLLHGPPGCGKTLMAHAIAGELNIPLLKVAAPELISGISGESETRIRDLFDQALTTAPCIIFLEEIDAIAPHRATAQREMEKRIVSQLLSCLDELNLKKNGDRVLVIGATNRLDSLDPALRRAGRFDREVCLGIPDSDTRTKILQVHTDKVVLAPNVNLSTIASLTPGFVGADLVALIREAAIVAIDRIFVDLNRSRQVEKLQEITDVDKQSNEKAQTSENSGITDNNVAIETPADTDTSLKSDSLQVPAPTEMDVTQESNKSSDLSNLLTWLRSESPFSPECLTTLCIEHSDFEIALRVVQPSAKREGFATVPDVTWNDIGSLKDIRQELEMAVLAPVRHAEYFSALGLTAPAGILFCGPPGCGKTLLAKAIANEAGINFISVKGPELLNMYVGESEKAVRQCFLRARNSAPCVIFFDELDALCPKRTQGDNSATSRVVNQMLTEMDGVEGREGVFLMAASNRPDIIDSAILRPGRLDKIIYVGLPTPVDRVDILRALTKNGTRPKFAGDIDLVEIGYDSKCDGFSGADLAALIREAGMEALKEAIDGFVRQPEISRQHIIRAFDKVQPSVREKDIKYYENLGNLYSIKKNVDAVTPMETPVDIPITDVVMEPMET